MSALAVLAFSAASLLGLRAAPQDNVVVIVVDQLAAWMTDPAQRAPLDLPNLDAIAASGTTFTRCYTTSPVCSANRLALLTGQYPFALGTNKLAPGVPHLGSILTAAGWDTGYVGKWHLTPGSSPGAGYVEPADRQGWRYFAGMEGAPHNYLTGEAFKQDDTTPISTAPWSSSWMTNEAVRFLRANRAKPFALVVNYGPPHPQPGLKYKPPTNLYTASQMTLRPNTTNPAAAARYAQYMSLAVTTDTEIGVLLSEINLATTYVVLTADHGDLLYAHGAASEQQKRRPWEECSRIPLMIAGPGIPAGTRKRGMISTVDVLPSLLQQLEVSAPPGLQGSVSPFATPIYFGHDSVNKSWVGERWRGLVREQIKYAVTESAAQELLYDLAADPYELTNLAPDPAFQPLLQSMRRAIHTRAAEVGDPFFR